MFDSSSASVRQYYGSGKNGIFPWNSHIKTACFSLCGLCEATKHNTLTSLAKTLQPRDQRGRTWEAAEKSHVRERNPNTLSRWSMMVEESLVGECSANIE